MGEVSVSSPVRGGELVLRPRRATERSTGLSGPSWLRALVLAVAMLFALFPLVATVLYSVATVWRARPLPDGFTLHWWSATLTDRAFLDALGRSVGLGVATVVLVNLLVLPPLYWSHVRNPRIRTILIGCALIPFVLPGVVMAAGIHRFVGLWPATAWLQSTGPLLLAAYVATSYPPYLWAVDAALSSVGAVRLWEAAETLGASPAHTLWRVIIPNIRVGIAVGSLLVFASVIGDLALARIITGSSFETLPLWQLRQLRGTDANPNGLAVTSVLSLALLFFVSLVVVLRNRGHVVRLAPAPEQQT